MENNASSIKQYLKTMLIELKKDLEKQQEKLIPVERDYNEVTTISSLLHQYIEYQKQCKNIKISSIILVLINIFMVLILAVTSLGIPLIISYIDALLSTVLILKIIKNTRLSHKNKITKKDLRDEIKKFNPSLLNNDSLGIDIKYAYVELNTLYTVTLRKIVDDEQQISILEEILSSEDFASELKKYKDNRIIKEALKNEWEAYLSEISKTPYIGVDFTTSEPKEIIIPRHLLVKVNDNKEK